MFYDDDNNTDKSILLKAAITQQHGTVHPSQHENGHYNSSPLPPTLPLSDSPPPLPPPPPRPAFCQGVHHITQFVQVRLNALPNNLFHLAAHTRPNIIVPLSCLHSIALFTEYSLYFLTPKLTIPIPYHNLVNSYIVIVTSTGSSRTTST